MKTTPDKGKRRFFAWFLSFAMILTTLNMSEFAIETYAKDVSQEITSENIFTSENIVAEGLYDDNDDLFEMYTAQTFGLFSGIRMFSATTAGAHLTGKEKQLYDALKPIIKEIADGERASGDIEIPGDAIIGKLEYTAAELGVDSIRENNSISTAAKDAMHAKVNINTASIYHALLADCSYELYWHIKTLGMTGGPSYRLSVSGDTISFMDGVKYSFKFAVDPTFKASGEDTYAINTTKTGAAKNAAANANEIVTAATDKNDFEKLNYYREQICDLVSYDDAAAASSPSALGSIAPWQLINVFDKDPSTNVVCEGYSKAFAYLCELTTFDSDSIYAYTVTGKMNGGNHMWNVIHMDDDKNYLVDVTNCDGSSSGAPNYLFLQGYNTVINSNGELGYTIDIPRRDALGGGSYEATTITYKYEAETTATYSTDELTIADADYVYRQQHLENVPTAVSACIASSLSDTMLSDYENWVWKESDKTKTVPATAGGTITATAIYTGRDKNRYDNTESTVTITAVAHSFTRQDATITDPNAIAATCTSKAKLHKSCAKCDAISTSASDTFEVGEALGHNFTVYVDETSHKCSRCTETESHDFTNQPWNTTTHKQTCKICANTIEDVTAPSITEVHFYDNSSSNELIKLFEKILHHQTVKVKVSCNDNSGTVKSGISAISYKIGTTGTEKSVAVSNGIAEFTLPLNTKDTVYITAIDKAGLTSTQASQMIIVENNAPTITDMSNLGTDWLKGNSLSIKVDDSESGIASIRYTVDENASTNELFSASAFTTTKTVSITLQEGTHTYKVTAKDNAGNVSNVKSIAVKMDKTAPTLSGVAVSDADILDVSAKISVSASDAASGVDKYYVMCATSDLSTKTNTEIAISANAKTVSNGKLSLSGLSPSTTYYYAVVVSDKVGNLSSVKTGNFTTKKTLPTITKNPTISGTYGMTLEEMLKSGVASVGGVSVEGTWSVENATTILGAGSSEAVQVTFTPANSAYDAVNISVTPQVAKATPVLTDIARTNSDTLYHTMKEGDVAISCTAKSGETTIPGTFVLKNPTKNLVVGTKNYEAIFTPSDANNYSSVTANISLTVVQNTLASISYTGTLAKASYVFGETFALNGLTVNANYLDGSSYDITQNVVYNSTLSVGQTSVTLSYTDVTEKTCSVPITVAKAPTTVNPIEKSYYFFEEKDAELIDLSKVLPTDCGTATYTLVEGSLVANGAENAIALISITNGKAQLKLEKMDHYVEDTSLSFQVSIISTNYEDVTLSITIQRSACDHPQEMEKEEIIVEPSCTQKGYKNIVCLKCQSKKESNIPIEELGHKYGKPVFTWNETFDEAKAEFNCVRSGCNDEQENHTKTVNATIKSTTSGKTTTYTAEVKLGNSIYTEKKSVVSTGNVNERLVISTGISNIPVSLVDANINTEAKIEAKMKAIVEKSEKFQNAETKLFDVELQTYDETTQKWNVVTADKFPTEGLKVTIPYPVGLDKDQYNFMISHMFTVALNGCVPGDVETPEVTKTEDGLAFTVNSLSPILVAWSPISVDTPAPSAPPTDKATDTSSPKTGDPYHAWVWVMIILAGLGIFGYGARQKRKHTM